MFWILSGLRKIRICILQHRVLIAMPELLLQADVAFAFMVLSFCGALRSILIVRAIWHDETSLITPTPLV